MRRARSQHRSSSSVSEEGRAIDAEPHDQLILLDLQQVDTLIAQLLHRRSTLPESIDLARMETEREELDDRVIAAGTRLSDLEAAQRRAEADLEPVRERRQRNQHRIDTGAVGDPKALAAMVEEVAHLGQRIRTLEDAELEVMEEVEQAQRELASLQQQVAEFDVRQQELVRARGVKLADIDSQGREAQAERVGLAARVPAALLSYYDKIRAAHGGLGAAALEQRRCMGCRIEANAADLRRYAAAAPTAVLRCEECGRILVRTPKSGF